MLGSTNCTWDDLSVQEHWNCIENVGINCVDFLAPLENHSHEGLNARHKTPINIKNLINVRNRLLKIDRKRQNCANAPKIKNYRNLKVVASNDNVSQKLKTSHLRFKV